MKSSSITIEDAKLHSVTYVHSETTSSLKLAFLTFNASIKKEKKEDNGNVNNKESVSIHLNEPVTNTDDVLTVSSTFGSRKSPRSARI
ncbi:hypothetical protein JTE90_010402 [Oedothorax gibbosus]|uniref:Uncharacterized protein n=1 Tax=Oedothorax gibbosus TaxID=931172 RepID=A0AAV6W2E6_9ARAC|nr:hypothetical protein JTE90_010402 [Oedothorax gibbosus]